MQPADYDVCIVGAGPVGGTLACRLAAGGMRVAVIDAAALPPMEHPDFDGRAYAIAAGSVPLLQDAGLWEALPQTPEPIREIRVTDGKPGRPASPLFLHFSASELGDAPLGHMLEARALRVALNARLHADPRITLISPARARLAGMEGGRNGLQLDDGRTLRARLVVAAEGRHSPLRQQAGITAARWPYRQSGIVCAIAHTLPHHGIALEHFLPAGPFAQLPMGRNPDGAHTSAIVWTERDRDAGRFMAMAPAQFGAEIARRLGGHLGEVRPVGGRWLYPLSAMYVHRLAGPRLALAGDAAHGIHPIAGQGLNLGLRDAIELARLLLAGGDPGDAALLQRYERARRADIVSMLIATDGLDRLFSSNFPPLRLLRDAGLAAVHRIPPLKRAFMRQAMGHGV